MDVLAFHHPVVRAVGGPNRQKMNEGVARYQRSRPELPVPNTPTSTLFLDVGRPEKVEAKG